MHTQTHMQAWVQTLDFVDHIGNLSTLEQAFGVDDSDVVSPSKKNHTSTESTNLCVDHEQIRDPNGDMSEERGKQKKVNDKSINEVDPPSVSPTGESCRSVGEILSSMDPVQPLSMPGIELSPGKPMGKVAASAVNAKRSTFWGRGNVSSHSLCFLSITLTIRNSKFGRSRLYDILLWERWF